jgi:epoxyqueuosine reductase QueG
MKKTILSEKIRNLADSNGIDALGFAEASEFKDYPLNRSKRRDPKLSLTDAKTIIVVGIHIGGSTGSRVSRKKPQTMTSSRT